MCPLSRTFCGSEYPPRASSSTRLTWITSSSGRGDVWQLHLQLFVTLDSQRPSGEQASAALSGHSKYFCFLTPSGSRLRRGQCSVFEICCEGSGFISSLFWGPCAVSAVMLYALFPASLCCCAPFLLQLSEPSGPNWRIPLPANPAGRA